ncbi:MAG: hypothetical protein IKG81_07355 [Bacteroidales bacterium]|nr:hypothetical protein [Bacteroidales bacterium]
MKENEIKKTYDRPKVVVKSVAVENGMALSIHPSHPDDQSNATTSQYEAGSWDM